uniref:Uncharacterized protein n=1 Tax=Nicotiana tabacum TaxID=4097 RepID=A0A1S3XG69_TOBAC|nr:PREDICTED: uncharacterized protein LOC107764838 [Nicotiana tabacum]
MMLLDGHQKNIILMINCQPVDKSAVEKLLVKILLHNLDLSGMKPLAIIMMLLLVFIMTGIQVCIMTVTMGSGILTIRRLSNMYHVPITMTPKQQRDKLKLPNHLMAQTLRKLLYLHQLL